MLFFLRQCLCRYVRKRSTKNRVSGSKRQTKSEGGPWVPTQCHMARVFRIRFVVWNLLFMNCKSPEKWPTWSGCLCKTGYLLARFMTWMPDLRSCQVVAPIGTLATYIWIESQSLPQVCMIDRASAISSGNRPMIAQWTVGRRNVTPLHLGSDVGVSNDPLLCHSKLLLFQNSEFER